MRVGITMVALLLPLLGGRGQDRAKGDDKPLTDQVFVEKAASAGMADTVRANFRS